VNLLNFGQQFLGLILDYEVWPSELKHVCNVVSSSIVFLLLLVLFCFKSQ